MTCEETRQSLSSYVDDCLSLPTRVAIDEHLDRCPVCRAEVAELRSLTRSLKSMARPTPPTYLAETITDLLTIEAAARRQPPKPPLSDRILRFIEPRLMPYTVGSCASCFMFFMMFMALRPHFVALREAALQRSTVLMVSVNPGYDLSQPITPEVLARMRADLAKERAPFAELSPTLDPGGALAALSRSYARPRSGYYTNADGDDMIVVTDVFSNGSAALADVVQPPRDKRMLDDFESALRQTAAFVPASLDRRPDTMRVIISLGPKVEVDAQKGEADAQKF